MARPRKSALTLELSGAFQRNPDRVRRDLLAHGPIGPWRPGSCDFSAIWDELVQAAPPNLLKSADRAALELAVRLIARTRADPTALTAAAVTSLTGLLDRLGLTPRGRQGIDAPAEAEDRYSMHRQMLAER